MVKLKDTFRKLAMVSAVFPMLALGGCAGGLPSQTLQTDVANIESQVQADADVICGFIPSFGAVAASASVIAEGVCNAIAKAPVVQPAAARMRANLAASGADVQVATARTPNGVVPIVGHFTR